MTAPVKLLELIELFKQNIEDYKGAKFNETQARIQFIDPMLELLGWDINNKQRYAEAYKDVIHEDALKIGGNTKAPDYSFRVGGVRKFFLEAKKPSINIKDDVSAAFQLRRYGWSAKLPLSILTDFEELAVYDCRVKPETNDKASTARVKYYTINEYVEKWDELVAIFSKESIQKGAFDKYADDSKKKRGTAEVDEAFLAEIEGWRETLAHDIARRNKTLSIRELNAAVQRIIDRIVFLRIAEDRGIEPYGRLGQLKEKKNTYAELADIFRRADEGYNSGLFHFRAGDEATDTLDTFTLGLSIDDKVIKNIIKSLYYPDSPYEFSVFSGDILGQVYEQFLGTVIRLSGKNAIVEEKPEVKKAGGVYYTPTYIVESIVKATLGQTLSEKTPAQASGLDARVTNPAPIRVLDPACGSGSFLIVAYQFLLDWYRAQYLKDDPQKYARGKEPKLYQAKGSWRLTIAEKRRILLTHIFGVDIDTQATEVTKLSLLLKVLEHESGDAIATQMDLFKSRVLPDLGKNIKCGNSIIISDFFDETTPSFFGNEEVYRINAFDWPVEFPFIKKDGGFDVVLGNPPWISLTGKFRNEVYCKEERDYLIRRYSGNSYMPNMYEYFISAGLKLLKGTGVFSFVVPDRFGYNDQFISLRRRILEDFRLESVRYRAPFPGVTADTLIFSIAGGEQAKSGFVEIGEFGKLATRVEESTLSNDSRHRFLSVGSRIESEIIDHIKALPHVRPLAAIAATTSGFDGKSAMITRERASRSQRPILKGESIIKYQVISECNYPPPCHAGQSLNPWWHESH